MRIGILQTGHVNADLVPEHGEYPPMFERLLGGAETGFTTYDVTEGAFPARVDAADAWLITGSRHGAYEDLPWIAPLESFLQSAAAARRPMLGVCFGHQIMAQALGGRVEKHAGGWGCGRHRYEVVAPGAVAGGAPESVALLAIHQDQVTAPPPEAQLVARSDFCPFAAFVYGPAAAPWGVSLQPHPEFDPAFLAALIAMRRGDVIPETTADAALATLDQPVDRDWAAGWFKSHLRAALGPSGA